MSIAGYRIADVSRASLSLSLSLGERSLIDQDAPLQAALPSSAFLIANFRRRIIRIRDSSKTAARVL